MKVKLIKINDGQPDGGFYIIKNLNGEPIEGKLSLNNCQAIERGWNLIEEMCKLVDKKAEQSNTIDLNAYGQGCLDAFQKALELMGDKKFSEDDMKAAYGKGFSKQGIKSFNLLIQSLQQTEWDVEIEMERSKFIADKSLRNDIKNGFNYTPKFDADGCLILKTFKSE